jgi:serine protease Do
MKHPSRLDSKIHGRKAPLLALAVCGALCLYGPLAIASDSGVQLLSVFDDTPGVIVHGSSGYLGVTIHDLDQGRANDLHLASLHGAEVVMLDHDAPACKAGVKLHDVILQMNGQAVDNVEQLRKMLHEMPVGKTVAFVLYRDGQTVTLNIQLGDRAKLEHPSFLDPNSGPEEAEVVKNPQPDASPRPSAWVPRRHEMDLGIEPANTLIPRLDLNPLYVGARVEPVSPQLADYFGVRSGTGLLVKDVYDDSPASAAGIRAGDIVLNVNGQAMVKLKDWTRAIRVNRGKQVQVTIFRDHQQQTVTMWAGSARNKG